MSQALSQKNTQRACPRLQPPGAQLTWWDDGAFTGLPCFPLSVITPPEWVLAVLWPDVTANEIPGVADIVCRLFTIPQVQLAPYRFRSLAHISCLITKVLSIVHAINNPALIWVYLSRFIYCYSTSKRQTYVIYGPDPKGPCDQSELTRLITGRIWTQYQLI